MTIPPRRQIVFDRAGGHCEYCGVEVRWDTDRLSDPNRATIDHLVPRCAGGNNELPNLVLACHPCNNLKDRFNPYAADRDMMARLTR